MIEIDADRAIELLRAEVAGNEDFVYVGPALNFPYNTISCVYEKDGQPCCLIGKVLHTAGVTVEELRTMDAYINEDCDTDILTLYSHNLLPQNLALSDKAVRIFNTAQQVQDKRDPWSVALQRAELVQAQQGD